MKPNYIEYELENGDTVTMTVSMALLYKMRVNHKSEYEKVSKNLVSGPDEKDVIQIAEFLHGAYICANMDTEVMGFQKFLEEMNQDLEYNAEKMKEIISPKKKQDSETHL